MPSKRPTIGGEPVMFEESKETKKEMKGFIESIAKTLGSRKFISGKIGHNRKIGDYIRIVVDVDAFEYDEDLPRIAEIMRQLEIARHFAISLIIVKA